MDFEGQLFSGKEKKKKKEQETSLLDYLKGPSSSVSISDSSQQQDNYTLCPVIFS